jgi:hypothetical protein
MNFKKQPVKSAPLFPPNSTTTTTMYYDIEKKNISRLVFDSKKWHQYNNKQWYYVL